MLNTGLSNSLTSICPSCRFASLNIARPTRRHSSGTTIGKFRSTPANRPNTHLDKYLKQSPKSLLEKKKETEEKKDAAVDAPKKKTRRMRKPSSEISSDGTARGAPAEDSVFGKSEEPANEDEEYEEVEEDGAAAPIKAVHEEIDPEALMNVLDPEPGKTMAWQRKKVIQSIRNRGQLTKEQIIKRTERECTVPSAMFKTSTKKLVHLARQISGKPIDEAIVQMQLSKKKVAQDIMKHLEYAKNMAIVSRGMGLGKAENRTGEPVEIELKDGKRKVITDQTGIYVDQAWVNKGDETMTPDYRGRGRVFTHTHRMASKLF